MVAGVSVRVRGGSNSADCGSSCSSMAGERGTEMGQKRGGVGVFKWMG
jgi:hypothetical protein